MFNASIALPEVARDAQRAFGEWRGERTVWLMKNVPQTCRWHEDPSDPRAWTIAVPAEHLERLDVFHIGENGHLADYGSVEGLLDAYLNVWKLGGLTLYPAPATRTLPLPHFEDGKVGYALHTVTGRPNLTMPARPAGGDGGGIAMQWPPDGHRVGVVSIDAESDAFYGPLKPSTFKGVPVLVSAKDPRVRSAHFIWSWPEPVNGLFPWGGGGGDALLHQELMVDVATRSAVDLPGAMKAATDAAAPYLSIGHATVADR